MISDVVLVVDKPVGITSFDVVRRVRRAARIRHVGHGGTLDPLASGVLPVCLGEATKLAQFLLDADKEYEATVRLGSETDTDDADGTVTDRHDPGGVHAEAVLDALVQFRGRLSQVPPAYSALKRAGRPLYAYARAGQPVEAAPREVVVHELELTSFEGPEAVRVRVRCSKGTYIRALARDLGRVLGVGGHLAALRRTRSGPFSLAAARPLDDVIAALGGADGAPLPAVSPAEALAHLVPSTVSQAQAADLRAGRKVGWEAIAGAAPDATRLCLLDPSGALLAVAEPRQDGSVRTLRVFGIRH
jgi:tRNA pseudouridine55 synthase